MRSWNQSRCPCGKDHRATSFISPPRGLERTVVRRAKSDRLRACFVVPTNHKAGYWKQLRSNSQGRLQLNDPKIAFEHSQAPLAAHTVFLVDFGGTDSTSPRCGQECVRRGRQPRWEPHEEEGAVANLGGSQLRLGKRTRTDAVASRAAPLRSEHTSDSVLRCRGAP